LPLASIGYYWVIGDIFIGCDIQSLPFGHPDASRVTM